MAQIKYSANLAAADFTFSFSYKGPSVMIAAGDQNYFQATADWAGQTPQRGINIPQVMYCENTVPTAEGYRSVAYKWFVEPALPLTQRFVKYFSIFEGTGASALLGITADKKIYVLSAATSGEWTLVTWNDTEWGPIAGTWDAGAQITWTSADIFSLIHISGYGTFAFNYLANSLVYLPLTGLDDTKLNGICASSGYLVAWDDTTIYWSATEHILDFVPSLITGAGSAKVAGLKGNIKLCKEIGGGFIIYSDVTVLSAQYSSNSAIPFIFDVLAGGAGIRHADHVTADINTQVHFVWSTSGLLGVELHQVKTMFPQLTDFIASGISDSSTTDGYPTVNWLDDYKEVRLAIVSGRYLCVSFGVENTALSGEYPTHELSQSLVYDMQLRRWGKLNVDHVQIFESPFSVAGADSPGCRIHREWLQNQIAALTIQVNNLSSTVGQQKKLLDGNTIFGFASSGAVDATLAALMNKPVFQDSEGYRHNPNCGNHGTHYPLDPNINHYVNLDLSAAANVPVVLSGTYTLNNGQGSKEVSQIQLAFAAKIGSLGAVINTATAAGGTAAVGNVLTCSGVVLSSTDTRPPPAFVSLGNMQSKSFGAVSVVSRLVRGSVTTIYGIGGTRTVTCAGVGNVTTSDVPGVTITMTAS